MLKTTFQISFVITTLAFVSYAVYVTWDWRAVLLGLSCLLGLIVLMTTVMLLFPKLSPKTQEYIMHGWGGPYILGLLVAIAMVVGWFQGRP
jgi:hypothetical protein